MLKESADLVVLTVTFDAKMTFEKQHLCVSSAAAQRLVIMRKSGQVFHDQLLSEIFLELCSDGLGVFIRIVVFGCRFTS